MEMMKTCWSDLNSESLFNCNFLNDFFFPSDFINHFGKNGYKTKQIISSLFNVIKSLELFFSV